MIKQAWSVLYGVKRRKIIFFKRRALMLSNETLENEQSSSENTKDSNFASKLHFKMFPSNDSENSGIKI